MEKNRKKKNGDRDRRELTGCEQMWIKETRGEPGQQKEREGEKSMDLRASLVFSLLLIFND